jgi:hypothetical protein
MHMLYGLSIVSFFMSGVEICVPTLGSALVSRSQTQNMQD